VLGRGGAQHTASGVFLHQQQLAAQQGRQRGQPRRSAGVGCGQLQQHAAAHMRQARGNLCRRRIGGDAQLQRMVGPGHRLADGQRQCAGG
jgi:hypothetical protein